MKDDLTYKPSRSHASLSLAFPPLPMQKPENYVDETTSATETMIDGQIMYNYNQTVTLTLAQTRQKLHL